MRVELHEGIRNTMVSENPKQATFWVKNLKMNTSEFIVVFNNLQEMKAKIQESVVSQPSVTVGRPSGQCHGVHFQTDYN